MTRGAKANNSINMIFRNTLVLIMVWPGEQKPITSLHADDFLDIGYTFKVSATPREK
jgi:hypothetical protein